MAHVNHFLVEAGWANRRRFKEQIVATRVAGATANHYRDYMNHLRGQERVARAQQGRRLPMSPEVQQQLATQRQVRFNQMSVDEQEALTRQRDSMWGQIPEHLQAKARRLAGR